MAFQAVALAVATYPTITSFTRSLPGQQDSFQHLWIMRWYKSCLLEGRSPFFCPDIQYPAGSPFGSFSPLHLQALVYIPLSFVIKNDALCYNLIWTAAFLFTGLGTTLLIWHVVGDRMSAAFGGAMAMLSAPMIAHSHGHTELITLGGFPLFMLAWIRFVDRPHWRTFFAATGLYVLVSMSAAYYMVLSIIPAVLYVVFSMFRAGPSGLAAWARQRVPWLLGMGAVTLPILLVLFSPHLWSVTHGYGLDRDRAEFDQRAARLCSYYLPTNLHLLYRVLPTALKVRAQGLSYLGIVPILFLMAYARRSLGSRLRWPGYFWAKAAAGDPLLARVDKADRALGRVPLPASVALVVLPPDPVHSRSFAVQPARGRVCGGARGGRAETSAREAAQSAPSGSGVRAARRDCGRRTPARYPYWRGRCGRHAGGLRVRPARRNPHARILEIPYLGAGGSDLNSACFYWQSVHGLTTSAGFSGHPNYRQESMIGYGCPFRGGVLTSPKYAENPGSFWIALD